MKRLASVICVAAVAGLFASCADTSDGYVSASVGGPGYYDGFYDDYYGPFYDGYWAPDGAFYFRSDASHDFRRDEASHFRHQTAGGFHPFRGQMHSGGGPRVAHAPNGGNGRPG